VGKTRVKNYTTHIRDIIKLSEILSPRDKQKLYIVSILQIGLSILDLIGVTLIGVIGALTISGVRSQTPTGKVGNLLEYLGLDGYSFQTQTVILALIAVLLLVTRTSLSVIITRRTLFFLSRRSAEISSRLITQVMSQPLSTLNRFSSQYIHYTLTTGTTSLTLGVFGNIVSVTSDFALLLVLGVGIAIIDPMTAILTVSIFGSILIYMYYLTNNRSQTISRKYTEISIKDSETLLELISGYREAFIRNRRGYFVDRAKRIKWEIADYSAELAWMPNISKYVVEIAFTLGTMAVAALQFISNDSAQAVGSLSLFLAAGTRITPALLRVQQNLVSINGSVVRAKPTIDLFALTDPNLKIPEYVSNIDTEHPNFEAEVVISNASFRYPGAESNTLTSINLQVNSGETVAIVGPSGAGKSTLIDLILGIYLPSGGTIKISGCTPSESITQWPGAIGYVPQEVVLMSGSIAANIASGFDDSDVSGQLIKDSITIAQLEEFIASLPAGAMTEVGERGGNLSGGQRQRVGIARAMFTKPQLLVLDEATSSLDGQTEAEISDAIQGLKGKVTLILIAHRLSTVRKADRIVYLESGRIIAQGTFDEVRSAVPNFNIQAQLMGL
jgi:ABC-type multidrug transport system fused ATPase/permease subunit